MRMLLVAVALMSVAGCASSVVQADTVVPTTPPPVASSSSSSAVPTSSETPPPPPPPPAPVPKPKPTPCQLSDGACIQLSTNQTWVVRGDKIVYGPVPITAGRPGYETPIGTHSVLWKVKDEWSKPYNGPMPYSTYFVSNGIAFHQGSLTEMSHGCIHLSMDAAKYYFNNLAIGDAVQVVA